MRTVTYRLADLKNLTINLGFVGENEHTVFRFDCMKAFEEYPDAIPSLAVAPPKGEPYPGVVVRNGDYVEWTITDSDVANSGNGEAQLSFVQDNVVMKEYKFRTKTESSVMPTGEAPEPVQNWIDEANQTLAEVEEAKQAFPAGGTTGQVLTKKSDEDYDTEWKTPQGGGGGTSNYNDLDNKPSINGVTLSGNKSLSDLSIPSQEDVNAKYTKPQGGIPASDIDPSAIPSPTSIIDDNAGEGDTNKVLSADKVTEITDELKEAIENVGQDIYNYDPLTVSASSNGWRLNESDGLCSADQSYKLVKYQVTAGQVIHIVSDDRFQFQTVASVPSSGSGNRVGDTYGAGTFDLTVPSTATYLIFSTPVSDSGASASIRTTKFDFEATQDDIGKYLSPKTVSGGVVTEWQYVGEEQDRNYGSDALTTSGYINTTNGGVTEYANAKCTDFIEIGNATTLEAKACISSGGYVIAFYNESKQVISAVSVVGEGTSMKTYNVDMTGSGFANAVYVRLSVFNSSNYPNFYCKLKVTNDSLSGKVINALGDSITSTDYTVPNWWQMISTKTGASFNNYGISGTSIAKLDATATHGLSFVERYSAMADNADIIIVMGGTNDGTAELGAWDSSDITTFYGALNTLIDGLIDKYPGKPIVFCTMMRGKADTIVADPWATLQAKTATDTVSNQLRAEAIKRKCAEYGIPCVDIYNESGINGRDTNQVYYRSNDNLHPSEIGMKRLACFILSGIEKFGLFM